MIVAKNGSKWGIKISGEDISTEIHNMIINAKVFVIVCGYNFSTSKHPKSIVPKLISQRINGIEILFIAPPNLPAFNLSDHTNTIKELVQNNIGVILNSKNHSKWILSDYGYYYGSSNFTTTSMNQKVEVVSFCESLQNSSNPNWMLETKNELLKFAISELKVFNNRPNTINLGTVNVSVLTALNTALTKILRFNPEIEKVITTLLNYEEVRLELSTLIDIYYPFMSFEELNKFWQRINRIVLDLDRLSIIGNDLLLDYQNQSSLELGTQRYNRVHNRFVSKVKHLIVDSDNYLIELKSQQRLVELTKRTELILNRYFEESINK
jgi:hypothetical protein